MAYLSTQQACEVLNVSRWTIHRLIADGELTAIKGTAPNSHFKIDDDSLDQYIKRNQVQASV